MCIFSVFANAGANNNYHYLQMRIFCLNRQYDNYDGLSLGQRLRVRLQSAMCTVTLMRPWSDSY